MRDIAAMRSELTRRGCARLGAVPLLLLLSCSSSSPPSDASHPDAGGTPGAGTPSQSGTDSGSEAGGTSVTLTGTMVDYETLDPVAGLTVTTSGATTTTDAKGNWTLSVPGSVSLMAPVITGTSAAGDVYSALTFPSGTPASGSTTLAYGQQVIPDSNTYSLEQSVLDNTTSLALIQVVVVPTGSCTSAAGGTLSVLSPSGTSVAYMSTLNIPDSSLTSFQAVTSPRNVAVIYNVPLGASVSVQVTHPTCTQMPFPVTHNGIVYSGQTTTAATEPGDNNSALAVFLQ